MTTPIRWPIVTAKYWHKVVPDGLHLTVSDTGWMKAMWGKLYGQWFYGSGHLRLRF